MRENDVQWQRPTPKATRVHLKYPMNYSNTKIMYNGLTMIVVPIMSAMLVKYG